MAIVRSFSSAYNVYNNLNPFFFALAEVEADGTRSFVNTVFPIIPSIAWRFHFDTPARYGSDHSDDHFHCGDVVVV